MYVIGTAGHVDHGKSTLVKTLTGIDPDRWEEEQRREMRAWRDAAREERARIREQIRDWRYTY